jgi:hypothetical protein
LRWGSHELFAWTGLLLISASRVARIIGVSHQSCPARKSFLRMNTRPGGEHL